MATSKDMVSVRDELGIVGRAYEIYKKLLEETERQGGTREHLKRLLTEDALPEMVAQMVVSKNVTWYDGAGTLVMPADVTAEGLLERFQTKIEMTDRSFPSQFRNKHHLKGALKAIERDLALVKGKSLYVLNHNFRRSWRMEDAQRLQTIHGYDANIAATLQWMIESYDVGCWVSVPNAKRGRFLFGGSLPLFIRNEDGVKFAERAGGGPNPQEYRVLAFRL